MPLLHFALAASLNVITKKTTMYNLIELYPLAHFQLPDWIQENEQSLSCRH